MTSQGSLLSQSCGLIWASTGERAASKITRWLSAFSPLWTVKLRTSFLAKQALPIWSLSSSNLARRKVSSQDGHYGFIWHNCNGTCRHLAVFCWLEVTDLAYTQEGDIMWGMNTGIVGVTLEYLPQSIVCPSVIHVPSVCKIYFTYSQGPQKFHSIKSSPQVPNLIV